MLMSVGLLWEDSRSREQGLNTMLNNTQERAEYSVSISDFGVKNLYWKSFEFEARMHPGATGLWTGVFHVPARYSDPLFHHSANAWKTNHYPKP